MAGRNRGDTPDVPIRVNSGGLLARLARGWRPGTWISEGSRHLHDNSGSLNLNCTNSVVYAQHLQSFWELGILIRTGQRVPKLPAPSKNLGALSFPGRQREASTNQC